MIGELSEPQYNRRLPVLGSSKGMGSMFTKPSPHRSGSSSGSNGPAGDSDVATPRHMPSVPSRMPEKYIWYLPSASITPGAQKSRVVLAHSGFSGMASDSSSQFTRSLDRATWMYARRS